MLHASYSQLGYLLDPLGLLSPVADISWTHCYSKQSLQTFRSRFRYLPPHLPSYPFSLAPLT